MRVLLVLLLVHGLCPALGEVAEAVVHYAAEGHLPHTAADQGDLGDQGDEHGCGTTSHHCGCCASQVVAAAPRDELARPPAAPAAWKPAGPAMASLHEPSPPARPPITS
jgi:hypothetical protein